MSLKPDRGAMAVPPSSSISPQVSRFTVVGEPEQSIPPHRHVSRAGRRASRLAAPPRINLAHRIAEGRWAGGIAPPARLRQPVRLSAVPPMRRNASKARIHSSESRRR
jgi:hypothetical protein